MMGPNQTLSSPVEHPLSASWCVPDQAWPAKMLKESEEEKQNEGSGGNEHVCLHDKHWIVDIVVNLATD